MKVNKERKNIHKKRDETEKERRKEGKKKSKKWVTQWSGGSEINCRSTVCPTSCIFSSQKNAGE